MNELVLNKTLNSIATRSDPLSVTIEIRSAEERDDLLVLWRELERTVANCGLACSADWTEVWLNVYGDLVPHRFVLGYENNDDTLCGICLLTEGVHQTDGPFRLRTLHVGTAGEPEADSACVEYNRLLARPEYESAFAAALAERLNSERGIDQWNLDGFAETDLLAFPVDDSSLQLRTEQTHWFNLASAREAGKSVLSSFRSATRRKVKRSLEGMQAATSGAELRVEWSETIAHATDIFNELVSLHQARWTALGRPGSYSSERFTRFHEQLLVRLVPTGRLAFVRVRAGDETVGCVQLLFERNRALLYQCGWTATEAKQSPGVVVDYLVMEECLRRGFDAYDFLAYETQHKRLLSNASARMIWAKHHKAGWKFAVLDGARAFRNWIRSPGSGLSPKGQTPFSMSSKSPTGKSS